MIIHNASKLLNLLYFPYKSVAYTIFNQENNQKIYYLRRQILSFIFIANFFRLCMSVSIQMTIITTSTS